METQNEADSGLVSSEVKEPPTQSLFQLFQECLDSYSQLCLALGEESCEVVKLQYVNLEKARGEFGRLRLWGSQSKATLPAQARGSLDDTLRHNPTLRDRVADMFQLLMYQLTLALRIIRDGGEGPEGSGAESDDSATSDSEDSSTVSDDRDDSFNVSKTGRQTATIAVVMSYIYDQVRLLYHLGMLLRRPALTGRYIKSSAKDGKLSAFAQYDYSHVVEKFRHWQRTADSDFKGGTSNQELEEEQAVGESDLHARMDVESAQESYSLMQRLAKANTRRREQLTYWAAHHSRPGVSTGKTANRESPLAKPQANPAAAQQEVAATGDNAPMAASIGKLEVKSVLSTPTAHSLSTAAVSGIDGAQTQGARPRTLYEETVVAAGQRSTRVPDVPISNPDDALFECPFCHMSLESVLMKDRQSWKQHVFRDLRPYLCTDDRCPNPDKMYATRHEWIYHEMQMHRRQWTCRDCYDVFDTQDMMADHLQDKHPASWTRHQLPVLIDMCETPLDDDRIVACPICPNELYLHRLLIHVADHMEEISLFVLPAVSDGDEDAGSHAIRGSRTGDKPEARLALSDHSLGFSSPGTAERPPGYEKSFEQLTELEEQDSYIKAISWNPDTHEQSRKPQTFAGHAGAVYSVAFSPDGKLLASGSQDQTVGIYHSTTGISLQTLRGHSAPVYSVAFSPTGNSLASGSHDNTIRLWDLTASSAPSTTLNGHGGGVSSIAFSPDGTLLASGSDDKTIRLWDATTGSALLTLEGHTGLVRSVEFSPSGKLLASASSDDTIQLWDPATGEPLETLSGHSDAVFSATFSPDCKLLASGSRDHSIMLWDPTAGRQLKILNGHSHVVRSVAFSPDGRLLASAAWDKTIRIWDPETGSLLRTIEEPRPGDPNTVAFSPDGDYLAAGFDNCEVRVWDAWGLV
ncbi:WD40-repeat-containing domain protein [Lasiosphaeris hirsuta]|uniref:WD40-repeat-containing domain protein n=1 Tax=Lasiosphaeris hirsuta TaxID=260670 RepID=A0AA40DST7_9PEZI|nr:WD40-repeat-containing domain protein [Lasiosphaeris hirsuta]